MTLLTQGGHRKMANNCAELLIKTVEGHGKFLENFNIKSVTNICNLWQSGKFFGGGCKIAPKNDPLLIDYSPTDEIAL